MFDVTLIADPSAPVWNAEAVTVLEAFTVPVIPNCDPLNVKLAESSTSPPVPAIRTRSLVRSSTSNVLAVTPPSASIAPFTSKVPVMVVTPETFSCVASTNPSVAIPVTFTAAKVAPCPPPRT